MDLTLEEQVLAAALAEGEEPRWNHQAVSVTVLASLHEAGWELTERIPLPDQAKARNSDPQTSHIAAASIDNMAERHRAVLQVARTFVDVFTYDELIYRYGKRRSNEPAYGYNGFIEDLPEMTPSSIRSRCAELRRAGWIEPAGRALSDTGRPCNTWRVTP